MNNTFSYIKKIFWELTFYSYLIFLIYVLFLHSYRVETYGNYNLVLFNTIYKYIHYYNHFTFTLWFLNLFGNIIIFMPFGFILPLINAKRYTFLKIAISLFFVSFFAETIQYLFHVGEFDVDDIFLNFIGGILGYFCYFVIIKKRVKRKSDFLKL